MSIKLVNQPRVESILDREGLDGLVVVNPINFYYFSGYWGFFNTPTGFDGSYFAVLPRDSDKKPSMVIPALEIRRIETKGRPWIKDIFSYTSDGDGSSFDDNSPKGMDYEGWPINQTAKLTQREKNWKKIVEDFKDSYNENSFQALVRAIKSSHLDGKKILIDDLRIERWLEKEKKLNIECIYKPHLFNEMRMVKTENEIKILKKAAIINEEAMLSSINFMQEGLKWSDVENHYMSEMAHRGGRGVYLMCGVGELPDGRCRKNEPIMFDALGQFEHYHGDFGRCAVIESPTQEHIEKHQSLLEGWSKAKEYLYPGATYSQISNEVGNYVRNIGFRDFRNPIVHSLGLEHTDDPKLFGTQPGVKKSQALENNMVINIDMPFTEVGWGSVHMEDTILITDDGYERLSDSSFELVISE